MFKLKFISKIMINWNQNCIIYIPKTNEGLRYERYILFIHVLVILNTFFFIYKSCV